MTSSSRETPGHPRGTHSHRPARLAPAAGSGEAESRGLGLPLERGALPTPSGVRDYYEVLGDNRNGDQMLDSRRVTKVPQYPLSGTWEIHQACVDEKSAKMEWFQVL